jgi:hypothetical protein
MSLEDRLAYDLALSGGTMPVVVVVDDEKERAAAKAILVGRKGAKLLTFKTKAEADAAIAAMRAAVTARAAEYRATVEAA